MLQTVLRASGRSRPPIILKVDFTLTHTRGLTMTLLEQKEQFEEIPIDLVVENPPHGARSAPAHQEIPNVIERTSSGRLLCASEDP
jgi:hypothetical protein